MGSTTICQLRVLIRKMGHKVMPTVRKRDAVGKLYDEIGNETSISKALYLFSTPGIAAALAAGMIALTSAYALTWHQIKAWRHRRLAPAHAFEA